MEELHAAGQKEGKVAWCTQGNQPEDHFMVHGRGLRPCDFIEPGNLPQAQNKKMEELHAAGQK